MPTKRGKPTENMSLRRFPGHRLLRRPRADMPQLVATFSRQRVRSAPGGTIGDHDSRLRVAVDDIGRVVSVSDDERLGREAAEAVFRHRINATYEERRSTAFARAAVARLDEMLQ